MKHNLNDLKNCGNLQFKPMSWAMLNEIIEELQQLDATQWCFDKGYGRMFVIVLEEFKKEILGKTQPLTTKEGPVEREENQTPTIVISTSAKFHDIKKVIEGENPQ